ncbi:hypothetical protein MSIMFI_05608 [Mycobacterium simulans]|nr:hypothetical protein MSIMFI_05608 [Mycobacterium simulans]
MFVGYLGDRLGQLCWPLELHVRAVVIRVGRIGTIGGQFKALGHAGQGLFPVGQLGGDAAVGVGQLTESLALPQGVVDVLHRQRRPGRGLSVAPGGIGRCQIAGKWGQRPPIGGDVVDHQHQHVVVVADPKQPCPDRDLGCQIKAAPRRRREGGVQLVRRPSACLDDLPFELCVLDG